MLRRPAWLVAATVVSVAVPVPLGGGAMIADGLSGLLVAVVGALAVRSRWRVPVRAVWLFGPPVVALSLATVGAADDAAPIGAVRMLQVVVLVPLAVLLTVRDRRDVVIIGGAVLVLATGEALYGLWQTATGTGASYAGENVRAVGTFGSLDVMALATVTGFGLLVTVAFALHATGRVRVALGAAGLVQVAALAASLSRGAWIALTVGLLVLLVVYSGRLALRLVLVGAALAVVVVGGFGVGSELLGERVRSIGAALPGGAAADSSVEDRYALWATAEAIWRERPLTGVGPRGFTEFRDGLAPLELSSGSDTADARNGFVRQPLLSPHNQYLLVLCEQGLVGLVAFAVLLGGLAIGLAERCDRTPGGLLAAGFCAWLLVDFLYADLGGPSCVLVGVLLGVTARYALLPGRVTGGAPR